MKKIINKLRDLSTKAHNFIYCTEFYLDSKVRTYGTYTVKNPDKIVLNGALIINDYVYINGFGGIEFGDNVILSAGSKIVSTGLKITDSGFENDHVSGKITIGNNVQIGAGAIVLQGVTICDNVIVGAGSILARNIEEPGVYVGTPVRKVRGFTCD